MLRFVARVLVVDDEADLREFLCDALASAGHDVEAANDGRDALNIVARGAIDVVVTDLHMPRMSGDALIAQLRSAHPDIAIVVLTAFGTVPVAVAAMKLGVVEFLEKPVESPDALRLAVARAAERVPRRAPATASHDDFRLTWGAPAMAAVESALRRVAVTETTVLLLGESGTGKEVAARAIHHWSKRAGGPFVAVNCASLSDSLLESELFGHERGAFTGATNARMGRIEAAAGGTFFLDEVGDLRPELQARLLRVIQEREFMRIGGTRVLPADVRWVAATNRDLAADVRSGRFREDLYHRLSVFPVRQPSLSERREDIPFLADVLLARVRNALGRSDLVLDEAARTGLTVRDWPGNVRELANVLERAVILSDGPVIRIPPPLPGGQRREEGPAAVPTMEQAEREAIAQALRLSDGNRRRAADHLGIGLRTLYEKLKRYGLG